MSVFDPDVFLGPDDPFDLAALRRDPEFKAYARQLKFEEEGEILSEFVRRYPRATGSTLEVVEGGESPDAIGERPDGSSIGVEITTIRRGDPERVLWDSILEQRDEMDPEETLEEIERLIWKKSELLANFRIGRNILVIAIMESEFDLATRLATNLIGDLEETGFEEIWLVDFKGIRDGAHREARLYGLYPDRYRQITERSMWDQKPYG